MFLKFYAFQRTFEKCTINFDVNGYLDLNSRPALKQPFGVSQQRIACCGPCKSDPIVVNFHTKKSMNNRIFNIIK